MQKLELNLFSATQKHINIRDQRNLEFVVRTRFLKQMR